MWNEVTLFKPKGLGVLAGYTWITHAHKILHAVLGIQDVLKPVQWRAAILDPAPFWPLLFVFMPIRVPFLTKQIPRLGPQP